MKNVLLISGGRTSAYMLRRRLDVIPNYRQEWLTVFCNTGKEMPQTLDFLNEIEKRWRVPIIWLEYDRVPAQSIPPGIFPTVQRNKNLEKSSLSGKYTHWFKKVDYKTASRDGKPFNTLLEWMSVLPNVVSRGCSMQLKIRTAMRYIFSLGHKEYISNIGIRSDESHRAVQILANCDAYEHPEFPLITENKTEQDISDFWRRSEFDLQLKSYQGNCDMCFLKAKWKRVLMEKQNPGMADWWAEWERKKLEGTGRGKIFRLNEPYDHIIELAKNTPEKISRQISAQLSDDDIPCSCAERAFDKTNVEEI